MKKFEVGQQVVCIKNPPANSNFAIHPEYVKGKIYPVRSVMYCSNCGVQYIDIGVCYVFPNGMFNSGIYVCDSCNERMSQTKGCWAISTDFAPLDEIDNLLNSSIESEEYELAASLRDVKTQIKQ